MAAPKIRVNRDAAPCTTCGEVVPAGAGRLGDKSRNKWQVLHLDCPKPERTFGIPASHR